jgi:hypothetical protein
MGIALLEAITLPTICKWLDKELLDTTNFIDISILKIILRLQM